jgi:hypothetical protein
MEPLHCDISLQQAFAPVALSLARARKTTAIIMARTYEVGGSKGCILICHRHSRSVGNNGNGSGRGLLCDPGALLLVVSFFNGGVS